MSFGFSIGDFITVTRLVNDVRKQFVNAPDQFSDISQDVKTLSTVLQDVEDTLADYEYISDDQKQRLEDVCSGCKCMLTKLNNTLKEFSILDTPTQGRTRKLRVAWKRLKWEQSDIDQQRRQLTLNISAFNTFLQVLTGQTTSEIKVDVKYLRHNEESRETDARFSKLLNWLSPLNFHPQQRDYISKRKEGTGAWLLASTEFQEWVLQPGAIMVCPGIPGAGKTMMVSIIIDHLERKFQPDPDIAVVYIYFSYQRSQTQEPLHLLGSLVKQLAEAKGPQKVPAEIQEIFQNHRCGEQALTVAGMKEAFRSAIKAFTKVFIILDALDEYQDRLQQLLPAILEVRETDPFNLFATTRPISAITSQLPTTKVKEIRADDEDILSYIDSRMAELLSSRMSRHPHLQELVRTEVLKASDGMFLLARLHLDSLRNWLVPGDLKVALRSLPKGSAGLDETYDNAMERIKAQPPGFHKLALNVLTWVIHVRIPLSPQLLLEALTIQPGSKELDQDFRPDLEDVDSLCAGLVTIDKDSDVVRLVHYTTQEYFQRRTWFPSAHFNITEACITYLSFDVYDTIQDHGLKLWSSYPFYIFAATQWPYHAEIISYDEPLLSQFLNHSGKMSLNIQALNSGPELHKRDIHYKSSELFHSQHQLPKKSLGIHLTAACGLTRLMRKLIENGQSAEVRNSFGKTPLQYAAQYGHAETVTSLLQEHHVDPNMTDNYGRSALHLAMFSGHLSVVTILLDVKQLDLKIRLLPGLGALIWARYVGHQEIFQALFDDHRINLTIHDGMSQVLSMLALADHHANFPKPSPAIHPIGSNDTRELFMFSIKDLIWTSEQVPPDGYHETLKMATSQMLEVLLYSFLKKTFILSLKGLV